MSNTIEVDNDITPFRHQRQFCSAPWIYRNVQDFFLLGGYGSGKSFSIVLLILTIVNRYDGHEITVGLGSVTISLFRKTIWVDLERILKMSGSIYSMNSQQNILRIGTISFQIVPTENPGDIFAYNFSIFICDEIDELSQDKALLAFTAIHERARVNLPDGREAFACFATTAQGYKGCYQITEQLRKNGEGFVLIRGHTRDNTSLSEKYLSKLEFMYNENERMAYLEGRFINLSTGRVYGDYDDRLNTIESFEPGPDTEILIGQDMNVGFCWGVAVFKKDNNLYIHREFNFESIGNAPKEMRMAYPTNPIKWFPDASADEIVYAYNREIRDYGIQVNMSPQNPSVIERIFCVNKLFRTKRMFRISSEDTEHIDMSLKVRQFDDRGDPQKGRGEKSPDHVCFPGYVKIETINGPVNIESIRIGDYVLTTNGFKKVTAWKMTGIRLVKRFLISGKELDCTPDHPVMTGRGKVASQDLTPLDTYTILDSWKQQNSHLMESFIEGILSLKTRQIENTLDVAQKILQEDFHTIIETYGSQFTEEYHSDFTYIIWTEILSIMIYQISKLLREQNTCPITAKKDMLLIKKKLIQTWKKLGKHLKIGTHQKRVGLGTHYTQQSTLQHTKMVNWFVSVAENLLLEKLNYQNSVPSHVYQNSEEILELTTKKEVAQLAEKNSSLINTQKRSSAELSVNDLGNLPVYNITVEDEHCYFADGILVSNCDALEYVIYRILQNDVSFIDIYDIAKKMNQGQKIRIGRKSA